MRLFWPCHYAFCTNVTSNVVLHYPKIFFIQQTNESFFTKKKFYHVANQGMLPEISVQSQLVAMISCQRVSQKKNNNLLAKSHLPTNSRFKKPTFDLQWTSTQWVLFAGLHCFNMTSNEPPSYWSLVFQWIFWKLTNP